MQTAKPNRAAIWLAVSTKRQADDEKASLPGQLRDAEALCEREGLVIVDKPLTVDGHSRRYLDFFTLAADARKDGIDAFDRLNEMLNNRRFDVLVVRDGDRFARTQALHAYIVERVIEADARIYSLADGWVDRSNYRMWIAMSGYRSASEVDALVKKRVDGMIARTRRGLPARIPVLSHKLLRDEITGKPIKVILDPAKRPLLDALAKLLLDGVALNQLANRLLELGFINPQTGKRYSITTFPKLLYNPWFWGHSAFNYDRTSAHPLGRDGHWAYDKTAPLPANVVMFHDTHEPGYSGELAARVQAEMQRREGSGGRRKPDTYYSYSGLLTCAYCGCKLNGHRGHPDRGYLKEYVYYMCRTKYLHKRNLSIVDCPAHNVLKREIADEFVRNLLTLVANEDFSPLIGTDTSQTESIILRLQDDIATLERQLESMIREQAERENPTTRALYAKQIDQMSDRLDQLHQAMGAEVQKNKERSTHLYDQQQVSSIIRQMGIDHFMQSPRELNQLLHRLLGKGKMKVKDRMVYLEVE